MKPVLAVLWGIVGALLSTTALAQAMDNPYQVSAADFYPRDAAQEHLGQLLFFDKILSGNQNIACASCHHPFAATGDGLSLPVGEGGYGFGVTRMTGMDDSQIVERVPRNSPPLFNLGALEYIRMFHDGRVEVDASHPSGFRNPAGIDLPLGLDNALAAQAMFPVTSATEMAGQPGENPVADAAAVENLAGPEGVWEQLAARLRDIPEYVELFIEAFEDIDSAEDIRFVHAANAIAAFEAAAWQCIDSPFDRFMAGTADSTFNFDAVNPQQLRGGILFYEVFQCDSCHAGPFQTDHRFHAIGVPQIGPGKGDNLPGYTDGHDDVGRERVTGDPADRFRFRTPSLRQVALTGPWGHSGAYNSLEAMVRHHLDAVQALENYDSTQRVLPQREDLDALDTRVMEDPVRVQAIAERVELLPQTANDQEVADLLAFLHALTDENCVDLRRDVPTRVPSGLAVFD